MNRMTQILAIFLIYFALNSPADAKANHRLLGPEVPFPLSAIMPFPWASIEGTWRPFSPGLESYFSFEVLEEVGGRRHLRIYQIDPQLGQVVARGMAVANTGAKAVHAIMVSRTRPYRLILRAFLNRVDPHYPPVSIVLTVSPLSSEENQEAHQVLYKLLPFPYRQVKWTNASSEE